MSTNQISPYSLSNFWRASAMKDEFAAAIQQPDASVDSIRAAWKALEPLLRNAFCERLEDDETLSLMNEMHTGMEPAAAMGLSDDAELVWERLRVLQGLISHLNLLMMVSVYYVATRPHAAGMFNYNTRRLICEIYEVLCSTDCIEEVEPWAEAVIKAAQEEDEKGTEISSPESDRADFEAWARTFATWDVEQDDDKALGTTGYTDVTLAIAWAAWQAGRRTQTVPPGGKLVPVAVPAAVTPNGLRPYICPTRTVADLVNNLLLLDQALPIHGAQHIEIEGRRRARAVQPVVSHERVKEGRWIGEGEELNAVVIWTRAEQPAAVSVTGAEFSQFLSDVMTAAGLVGYGKQRCKALAARLGDMVMRLRVEPPPKADHFRDATQMVPQGWQLVPVEPTDGMRATFEAQKGTATFFTNTMNYIGDFVERYRAMLAAAPQPPVDHLRDATQMIGKQHAQQPAPPAQSLLPCPFCGATAHFEMDADRWEWIECDRCGMQGNRGASLMEDCKPILAEAWNRRAHGIT